MEVHAKFNDGKTAKTHVVKVVFGEGGVVVLDTDGNQIADCPAEDVRVVDKGGARQAVRLKFGDAGQERLVLSRRDDLTKIEAVCSRLYQGPQEFRSRWRTILVVGLAAIISVTVIVKVGIPLFAEQVARALPVSTVARVGDRVHDEIIKGLAYMEKRPAQEMLCNDKAGLALINRLIGKLVAGAEDKAAVKISVINSKIINAAALPGGRIILFRGMLEFVKNEGELASVLAHEFGHVQLRHPTKNVVQGATLGVLMTLLIGDVAGGLALTGLSTATLQSAYSRDAEREADAVELELMRRSGLDIEDSARFFKRLQEKAGDQDGIMSFLSSHPPLKERVATAQEKARQRPPGRHITKILTRAEWAKVKGICGT
ncbi:MAG: M48 family metallopeptidase [Rhodospirillaceae bacterium]|jgi:beta-barrel assembly-enhancing protease|nr:M48 family metallopeptidase [Rhodospirillales bacterium]MBT3907588.1 M48 family metallopeptidase [Rhodospirillaceae bacterium]MBT4701890.1 M48 family metallopeptidase [Rhodospirillaceae bacterium]MBT5033120.1 M48 family metallopeptidase [Rhodospirillaceae bacterium]MBT6219928.1 M48 family metallopeptidase [Rhodospirillaceae bacterium]